MTLGFAAHPFRTWPERPALWWLFAGKELLVRVEPDGARPLADADLAALALPEAETTWVGELEGRDCAARALPPGFVPPAGYALRGLRRFFGVWPGPQVLVAGVAAQLLDFEDTHRFCGRCGKAMVPEAQERARRCPGCGFLAYPRLSPAVIVLVRRGREALLARSGRFPLPFFSTLAGFVEVGESLEETVAREIREEVGIAVEDLRYFGSQPWPFPHSLMVGFVARYAGGELRVDGEEIAEARWVSPESLPPIPPPLSIARALIDAWLAEVRGPGDG
jgi:NAD+ diphosphatase